MNEFLLYLTVLGTSVLSGVLGMAGGLVLKGALIAWISVSSSMILHGFIQMISNGARAWTLRSRIVWSGVPMSLLGSLLASLIFIWIPWKPEAVQVYLFLGLIPFLGALLKRSLHLELQNPWSAMSVGLLTNIVQLVSGVGGPVLDIAFQNSSLGREQIVGTKAFLQACSHAIKALTYGWVLHAVASDSDPIGNSELAFSSEAIRLLTIGALLAIAGTWIGTRILARLNDRWFRKAGQITIYGIGAYYLWLASFQLV